MKLIRLERLADIGDTCTLGVLVDTLSGTTLCKTLELPNRENQRNISRIPAGCYSVRPYHSSRFGECFAFDDSETHPRTAIRIHQGNTAKDTSGCVLVGKTFGEASVLTSRETLLNLRGHLPEPFVLHVTSPP